MKEEKARVDRYGAVFVRVYAGEPAISSILAISSGSPNRLDIELVPGNNKLIVTRKDGRLSYQRLHP